ncbi:hypothetical protein B0T26DRAFT_637215 [Lasiosphaeria miniovina]|uniref:Uncharacterized protein n=1 Tax=Lasiosphaeria miniovina TaxID=1954250 RepID=A0AA40B503_9PEZI|nr:uncharacterized protein B0T26DRAFT_637215 [Lasiosphaeria miniovina]KAK0727708.1 hypothetical protein B0T26DRAFT_637215 [Lasiosphaeria miniovina]
MSALHYYLVLATVLGLSIPAAQASTYTNQFQQWYPQFGWIFDYTLHANCSDQLAKYRAGVKNYTEIDRVGGGGTLSALTQPVVQCILANISEYLKGQMATSQVLLGVMPTILSLIGPGTDETATFLLVGRRPLLFLLLSLGTSSVYFERAFKYPDPSQILADHPLRLQQPAPCGPIRAAIIAGEYLLALAAVTNIVVVCKDLGIKTICIFWSDFIFAPMLWGSLSFLVHVGAVLTLRMRLRRLGPGEDATGRNISARQWFELSSAKTDVRFDVFPESRLFVLMAWLLSMGTIVHILFGTAIFSSTTFIGPLDALTVLGRYMASVMACRIISMYELAGLRDAAKKNAVFDSSSGGRHRAAVEFADVKQSAFGASTRVSVSGS